MRRLTDLTINTLRTIGAETSARPSQAARTEMRHEKLKDKFLRGDQGTSLAAQREEIAKQKAAAQISQNPAINTGVKDMVVIKHVDLKALMPLENVYGGGPEKPISLIPDSEIAKQDGTFKYCVTKHNEMGNLDVLMAKNISGAHVGMMKIAKERNCDVVMAGHVTFHAREGGNSEVYALTNTSGHLQPEGTYEQQQIAEQAFNSKGMDAQGRYVPRRWDEKLGKYVGKSIGDKSQDG